MIRRNLKLCRDYGMNKGIPFIKIADHVDVNFHPEAKRVSGLHWPLAISVVREGGNWLAIPGQY